MPVKCRCGKVLANWPEWSSHFSHTNWTGDIHEDDEKDEVRKDSYEVCARCESRLINTDHDLCYTCRQRER